MEKGMGRTLLLTISTVVAVAYVGGIGSGAAAVAAGPKIGADARLGETIERAMEAEGPFFTPAEQRVIRAKCGYAPGEWDGRSANMSNGVFTCTNGKRVADAEMRQLMDVAGARIGRRVSAAMNSAGVREAIGRVTHEAVQNAMRDLDLRGRRHGR